MEKVEDQQKEQEHGLARQVKWQKKKRKPVAEIEKKKEGTAAEKKQKTEKKKKQDGAASLKEPKNALLKEPKKKKDEKQDDGALKKKRKKDEPCQPPKHWVDAQAKLKMEKKRPIQAQILAAGFAPDSRWQLTSKQRHDAHREHGCCTTEQCPYSCKCLECPRLFKIARVLGDMYYDMIIHPEDSLQALFRYRFKTPFYDKTKKLMDHDEVMQRLRLYFGEIPESRVQYATLKARDFSDATFGFVDANKLETMPTFMEIAYVAFPFFVRLTTLLIFFSFGSA